jgi:hypothetical protein
MDFVETTNIAANREISNAVKLASSVLDRVVKEKTYRSHMRGRPTTVVARQRKV